MRIWKVRNILENEDALLNLAICSQNSHISPAEYLGIEDELLFFEFNMVCAFVYEQYQNKREAKYLETQLNSIAIILGADASKLADDEDAERW